MKYASIVALVLVAACGTKKAGGIDAAGGGGDAGIDAPGGDASNVDAQSCGVLAVTFRDFQIAHPDFEVDPYGDDRGLVKDALGSDNKPEYKPAGQTLTVTSKTTFDQWYRDVAGTNMTFAQTLPLTESPPGTFTYDNQAFFPLDNIGWGNESNPHNFHFTSEIHTTFRYRGGENFSFTGDDDLWVFVNKRLAIDLGGIHGAETAMIDFDAQAAALGITVGNTYQLDLFHAERHTDASTFRAVTTIDCFIIQ